MRKSLITSAVFGLMFITTAAMAEVPYGPAGCGLGSMVIGNEAGFMQLFAATTNGISGNQTFGITTGTLGCEVGGGGQTAKTFIEGNREILAKDMARGSGETIENLSSLAQCKDHNEVAKILQSNFQEIFPNAGISDSTVSNNIIETLRSNPTLECNGLAS